MAFSRRQLIDEVWGETWVGDEHLVDVHIGHLRRKLGDDAAERGSSARSAASATGWEPAMTAATATGSGPAPRHTHRPAQVRVRGSAARSRRRWSWSPVR